MTTMILDIETLPADDEQKETLIYLYNKKVLKDISKKKTNSLTPSTKEEFIRETSFDGGFGRVLCIAYTIDNGEPQVICNPLNEKRTLEEFWEVAKGVDIFVGHNILDFDMRFLYQRSVVLEVTPSKFLSFARYRSNPIYDTAKEWSKWGSTSVSLEHLALALGIPSPKGGGIDGSEVADFYKAGKVKEICDYCIRDVETTRLVYKKMNFSI